MDFAALVSLVIRKVLNPVIGLLVVLGLVYFLAGVLKYIQAADDADARRDGRLMMVHGVIGLFVMISVWGLVFILTSTFNLSTGAPPFPQL